MNHTNIPLEVMLQLKDTLEAVNGEEMDVCVIAFPSAGGAPVVTSTLTIDLQQQLFSFLLHYNHEVVISLQTVDENPTPRKDT